MNDMFKKVLLVIGALIVLGFAITLLGHLLSLAIKLAIFVGIGAAIVFAAKKARLIK